MKRLKEFIGSIYFFLMTLGVSVYCYAEEVAPSKGNNGSTLGGYLMLAWIILTPIITHKIVYPIHRRHFLSSADKVEEEVLLSDFERGKKKIGMWIGDCVLVFCVGIVGMGIIVSIFGK